MYTIIEDCSPYYIKFTHPDIGKIVNFCKHGLNFDKEYEHDPKLKYRPKEFNTEPINDMAFSGIMKYMPFFKDIKFKNKTIHISDPGLYFPIHKDSTDAEQFGINYMVHVEDELCTTNWYSDDSLANCEKVQPAYGNYGPIIPDKTNVPPPTKSTVVKNNEAILVNTGIFHNWDNSCGTSRRYTLILRNPENKISFEQARKILFGH